MFSASYLSHVSYILVTDCYYEDYLENNYWECYQNKQLEKNYYIKTLYISRLLLNRVTVGIEAFVSRSKSLYACAKEVCCLSDLSAACQICHILTPSINSFYYCGVVISTRSSGRYK
jgi:hypothetical protein